MNIWNQPDFFFMLWWKMYKLLPSVRSWCLESMIVIWQIFIKIYFNFKSNQYSLFFQVKSNWNSLFQYFSIMNQCERLRIMLEKIFDGWWLYATIIFIYFETFWCFTKFSFHYKWNDARLLLTSMVNTCCLTSCRTT